MTTPLLIVISIVLIIVGFILALLVTPLLGLDNKSTKAELPHEVNPGIVKDKLTPLTAERSLQVTHDPRDNRIIIEIDGQVYTSMEALSQEQRQFLSSTSSELVTWMSRSVLDPGLPVPARQASLPPIKIEPGPVEPTPAAAERSLVNSFLKTLQPGLTKTPPQLKSLAAQVDEVLQEKLPFSGLSHHSIHLVDLPNYGMSVQVDLEQYPGIDAVPDEAIRKFIREAVEEWKRRTSLGSSS
jgi:hypothetical protein